MAMASNQTVTGVDAAVKAVGGRKKDLAAKLGLTGAAITRWGDTIPIKRVFEVEKATGVSRAILRPDLFGEPKRRQRAA